MLAYRVREHSETSQTIHDKKIRFVVPIYGDLILVVCDNRVRSSLYEASSTDTDCAGCRWVERSG